MKFTNSVRAGVLLATLLLGCSEPQQPARTVSWYRQHPAERKAVVEQCADDPGTLGGRADCINAKQAAAIEGIGSFRNLPPLNLPPPHAPGRTPSHAPERTPP